MMNAGKQIEEGKMALIKEIMKLECLVPVIEVEK